MSATTIRFKGKVINGPFPEITENMKGSYVEGFYYQLPSMTKKDVIRHCIYDHPVLYEVDPSTVKVCRHDDLPIYKNPITKIKDIKDLQQDLVECVIKFIKRRNLKDIYEVNFSVDGLEGNAIEFGEWTPTMDSYIQVNGLQEEDGKDYRVRKEIGEYM
jgi:hypothetical protein